MKQTASTLLCTCWLLCAGMISAFPAAGQTPLTLQDAARTALESHPVIEAATAGEREAEAGIGIARSGRLPTLSWVESFTRSDNPVFVFGTLLNQRRFGEENFGIAGLNNPDSIQNFQSLLKVEQILFDARRTKHAIRSARLARDLSATQRRSREMDVLLGVVRTYFGVSLAAEQVRVAEESVRGADADLRQASSRFEAGLTTKADVLSVQVHRASAEQERIHAANNLEVARAALSEALGLDPGVGQSPLTPLTPAPEPSGTLTDYIALALRERPDIQRASLGLDIAEAQTLEAKSALWPTVVAQGAFEADRARFVNQGGGNWLAGVSMRWELWKGSENRFKVAAARHGRDRAAALERQASGAAALQIRQAWHQFRSAAERLTVAETAVKQAEESLRIIRNRYTSGLETVTGLLRGETALTNTRFRRLAALYEQRTSSAALEHAAGRLTLASEVLQ